MFDKDCSGTISSDELKSMFGANQDINSKVWDDLLKEADNDGNGEVFLFLLQSLIIFLDRFEGIQRAYDVTFMIAINLCGFVFYYGI